MFSKIDCFLPCCDYWTHEHTIQSLLSYEPIGTVFLLMPHSCTDLPECLPGGFQIIRVGHPLSSETLRQMASASSNPHILLGLAESPIKISENQIMRLSQVIANATTSMIYADYDVEEDHTCRPHSLNDYTVGGIRDDFDFGQLVIFSRKDLTTYLDTATDLDLKHAGFYDFRLYLSRIGDFFHLRESLYTGVITDKRASGEKQFDYVSANANEKQKEMEQAATKHLKAIGAVIDTSAYPTIDFKEQDFEVEASVIIPVYNRHKTIADAVKSALRQQARFAFNVIVVDNHSTDGTTQVLEKLAETDPRLVHIIPEAKGLKIGGCWNLAINSPRCGRFSVQLDSDDIYSHEHVLDRVVETFYQDNAAMVIGSYRICDFELQTLPPGLITHSEWSDENGPNNALRINGLGAPRAFFTPIIRSIGFPNVSYGEDYAAAISICRNYRIARIYDELYLCRRWAGNSDADLSIEKQNINNAYKDHLRTLEIQARQKINQNDSRKGENPVLERFCQQQKKTWKQAAKQYLNLREIQTKTLEVEGHQILVQYNPARSISTAASIKPQDIAQRPCFLCPKNRPEEQMSKTLLDKYSLLINPYPILPLHLTIPSLKHEPQTICLHFADLLSMMEIHPDLLFFYNGAGCGASAPDHMHFQAGKTDFLPLRDQWDKIKADAQKINLNKLSETHILYIGRYIYPLFCISGDRKEEICVAFESLLRALPTSKGYQEAQFNLLAWKEKDKHQVIIIPRSKHRPDCYGSQTSDQMIISPGAIDMVGIIITTRLEDYNRLNAVNARQILQEVTLKKDQITDILTKLKAQ